MGMLLLSKEALSDFAEQTQFFLKLKKQRHLQSTARQTIGLCRLPTYLHY